MSQGFVHQRDATDYLRSSGIQDINIRSFDDEYLATCVRFAQSHGLYPTPYGQQEDISFPQGSPRALHLDPSLVGDDYQNPYIGNTSAGPVDAQHNNGNDPYHHFSTSWDNFDEHQIESSAKSSQHYVSGLSSSTSDTATHGNALQNSSSQSLERQDLASKKSRKEQALAISHNYDPFWMQKTEVQPHFSFATGKKMKFERLFCNGVIQEGDYLAIPVNYQVDNFAHEESCLNEDNLVHEESSLHEDMAILTFTDYPTMKTYPTLVLTLRDKPNYHHPIPACKGPNQIVSELNALDIKQCTFPSQHISDHLLVWRGDSCLGTLNDVKIAYWAWLNDMDARCANTQTKWRRTRKAGGNVERGESA